MTELNTADEKQAESAGVAAPPEQGGPGPNPLLAPILGTVAVATGSLAFDLAMPLGIAGAVPHILLVLIGFWFPQGRHFFYLAGLGTALTVLGYVMSPPGAEVWVGMTNRTLVIVTMWATAFLMYRFRRINRTVQDRAAELENAKTDLERQAQARRRAERILRESESRFRDFALVSSDWHWELDRDLKFQFFSERFFPLSGVLPEALIGQDVLALAGRASGEGEPDPLWSQHLADLEARRAFRDFRFPYTRPDGEVRVWSIGAKPVFDESGSFTGYRGTGKDLTELVEFERALAETNQRFRNAVESLHEAFALYDGDDRLVICNSEYIRLHTSAKDLLKPGMKFEDLARRVIFSGAIPAARGREDEFMRERLEQHRNPGPARVRETADGIWYIINETKTPDGGIVVTSTDISELKQAQLEAEAKGQALHNMNERFRGAVEVLQEAFALFDKDDRLVIYNNEYSRLHAAAKDIIEPGMKFETLVRTNVERGIIVDAIGREEEHIRERLEQHRNPKGPIVRELTNGTWYIINEARTPEGGIALTETDITELKRAQISSMEAERRFRALYDETPIMLHSIDRDARMVQVNDFWLQSFGYERHEVIGRKVTDFMTSEDAEKLRKAGLPGFVTDEIVRDIPRTFIKKNGERMETLVTVVAEREIADGDKQWLACVIDVTEQRKIERMKGEFVSMVSHELRTPLTAIIGALGMVRAGTLGQISDTASQMVEIAHANSERLVRLINDILDIDRIEGGNLEFRNEAVALVPFLEHAVASNRTYAEEFDVTFAFEAAEDGGTVWADQDRLMQVVANLLSNAAKFSPPGATVRLSVEGDDDAFRFRVIDEGAGIPAAFHPYVFEKFRQADSSDTRRVGGTGLGLSITKAIVERLGGTIGFESKEGAGTVFLVELPKHAIGADDEPGKADGEGATEAAAGAAE